MTTNLPPDQMWAKNTCPIGLLMARPRLTCSSSTSITGNKPPAVWHMNSCCVNAQPTSHKTFLQGLLHFLAESLLYRPERKLCVRSIETHTVVDAWGLGFRFRVQTGMMSGLTGGAGTLPGELVVLLALPVSIGFLSFSLSGTFRIMGIPCK